MLTLTQLAAGSLAALAITSPAQVVPVPPADTVAEICAATGVAQVDEALAGIAETELVGELAPLVDLVVPTTSGTQVAADVELDAIRTALACDAPPVTTPPATTDPTVPPVTTAPDVPNLYENCDEVTAAGADPLLLGDAGYRPALDADGDGIACEDSDRDGFTQTPLVPVGGVETGDGSTE